MKNNHWHKFPSIKLPAPVLSLAAGNGNLWAGGTGGVARYETGWQSLNAGLPLSFVSALCFCPGWLLAGGTEGISRSSDGGDTWQKCDVPGKLFPIGAIIASPAFESDTTLLSATLGGGVLRSENAGQTWQTVNNGLDNLDVLTLAWQADTVLAATTDGIYLSSSGGRAWCAAEGTKSLEVNSVMFLPDKNALCLLNNGSLLHSQDNGSSWQPYPSLQLPANARANSLLITQDGIWLVGAAEQGTLYSVDEGVTWVQVDTEPALVFASDHNKIFAGLTEGLVKIENGQPMRLPLPPLHDLCYFLVHDRRPVVAGLLSGIWRWNEQDAWEELPAPTSMVTTMVEAPGDALILSGPEGILRSTDQGTTWQTCLEGEAGMVAHISFRPDGSGLAGSADGLRLLHSRDQGLTWEETHPPFGGFPLIALQANDKVDFAATYSSLMQVAQIWFSRDKGQTWEASAHARTDWPIINTLGNPAIFSLGGDIFVSQPAGSWTHLKVGDGRGKLLHIAGNGETLFALTTRALLRSDDKGYHWAIQTDHPAINQIINIAMDRKKLFLLLTEGRIWSRPL